MGKKLSETEVIFSTNGEVKSISVDNFYGNIELLANSEQLLFNGSIIPSEIEGFNISNVIPFNEYFVPGDELTLTISDKDGFYNAAISKVSNNLFFEIIIAPKYTGESLEILKSKKNRIILIQKKKIFKSHVSRDVLNGKLKQEADNEIKDYNSWQLATEKKLNKSSIEAIIFSSLI